MIEICDLQVSTLFLFKEQSHPGRCVVAYKDHVNELFELLESDRNAFMADVCRLPVPCKKHSHLQKLTTEFIPIN